jgi:hypothetical protein
MHFVQQAPIPINSESRPKMSEEQLSVEEKGLTLPVFQWYNVNDYCQPRSYCNTWCTLEQIRKCLAILV